MTSINSKQLEEYLKKRLVEKDFLENLQSFVDGFIDEMLNTPLDVFFAFQRDLLTLDIKQEPLHNLQRFLYLLLNIGEDQLTPYFQNVDIKPKEFLSDKNYSAIAELVSTPLKVPPQILDKVIDHPAMQNLLIDVVHDAIIGFNKKYNPFFGAMAAVGLDKQIKGFILPFMSQAIDITKNFVSSGENQQVIKDFIANVYHVMMDQPISLYAQSYDQSRLGDRKKMAFELGHELSGDEVLLQKSREEFIKLLNELEKQNKGITLQQLAQKYNIELSKPQLNSTLTQMAAKYLQSPSALQFLSNELNLLLKE